MRPVHLLAGMQPADHVVTSCCGRLLEDVPADDWVTGTPEQATCPGSAVTAVGDAGHTVVIADGHATQARCTCGWRGPDRTDDPHALRLAEDDRDQHLEREGVAA